MEDSWKKALKGGDSKNERCGQWNDKSSEGSVSPHNRERERPQASGEDASSKTIEFLRARLLAERATSKAAKECAEQNAKRLTELERLLELEMEQRTKAEAAMQEVMAKLRITCLSSVSDNVESDSNGVEEQRIPEEREGQGDVCSSNSICIAATEEEEIIKVDSNNSRLQEDSYLSANSVQCEYLEQRKGDSCDLISENEKAKSYDHNLGFIEDLLSNQRDIKHNCLALSSQPLQDQAEHSPSTDPLISLTKDDQDDNGKDFKRHDAPERFTERNVDTNSRAKLEEEKINELFHQMGNEVTPLAGEDQKELLRLKLHELVDQIVCLSQKEVHKHENSTVPTYDHSKLSSLGDSCEQIMMNDGNVEISNLQPEIPCKGLKIVDSLRADKSFQSSSCFRNQNETTAPSIDRISCKRHDDEWGHGLHCCGLRSSACTCQHLDFLDTSRHEKEELCKHKFLEHKIPMKFRQTQTSGMQPSLENKKSDELSGLQCRIMPQLHCNDWGHEFHLKMRSFNGRATTHSRLYHNNEKTICFRRNFNHYQAAGNIKVGKPPMFSGSDACMPRHHDFNSSHDVSYRVKRNCPKSMDILPHGIELSPQKYCHTYLPMQLTDNCDEIITCNMNAGYTKSSSKYNLSRGTPLADPKVPRLKREKLGGALIALRQAKEQMENSIITKQNSSTYIDLSSLNDNVPYKKLLLR